MCVYAGQAAGLLGRLLGRERTDALTLSAAFGLNLVMPFFWAYAGQFRYVSYQSGNIWHNSTYQCMKLLAIAAIALGIVITWRVYKHFRDLGGKL